MEPNAALSLMALILVLLCFKAGSVAMSIWIDLRHPLFMQRMHRLYALSGKRCMLLGAVNVLLLGFTGLALLNAPPLALLGLLLLALLGALAVLGYANAYHHLGERLVPAEALWPRWRVLFTGGLLAEFAFLAPVLGQLFSLAVLLRGLGAALLALLGRERPQDREQAGPPIDLRPLD